ncbi:MAG: hypothetical protein V9F03_14185 [Microthrixaceae bacterium]
MDLTDMEPDMPLAHGTTEYRATEYGPAASKQTLDFDPKDHLWLT